MPEIYIVVDFRWLILPIISVIFALIFLVAVMIESAQCGIPAWKMSQIVPLLSLDQSAAELMVSSSSNPAVEKSLRARAMDVQIKLEQGKEGIWKMYA